MDPLQVADALVSAIEAGDAEAVRSIYAEDARIWHNFDNVEQTVDENVATLGWLVSRLPERRYEVVRRERLEDGFLQQHVLRGRTRGGDEFSLPACIVCRVDGDRITRLDEYLDSRGAAALFAD